MFMRNSSHLPTDDRSKCSNGGVREEDKRQDHRSVLVRYKFSHCNVEAELDCFTESVDSAADDEGIHIVGTGADDDSNQGNHVAANEEPPAAKEIRKAAEDCIRERQSESSSNINPCNVIARTDFRVDVGQDIGRQDQEDVRAEGRETETLRKSSVTKFDLNKDVLHTAIAPMKRTE